MEQHKGAYIHHGVEPFAVISLTRNQVFPLSRREAHPIGPGIEAVDKPRRRNTLDDLTSLE